MQKIDLVLRLREARRINGMTQREAAEASGVGEKSISSFETGRAVNQLKLRDLENLAHAYGLTVQEILSDDFERVINELAAAKPTLFAVQVDHRVHQIVTGLQALESERRDRIIHGITETLRTARQVQARGMRLVTESEGRSLRASAQNRRQG